MSYQAEQFAQTLREARLRKGWSQRDLSRKAGVPQAHISKIENGVVDLKLSTLVELTRFLDLELILAPRTSLPAVQALIREAEANFGTRSARGAANALTSIARRLRQAYPDNPAVERLASLGPDIAAIAPLFQSPGALAQLQDAVRDIRAAAETPGEGLGQLRAAIGQLSQLRSTLVHARAVTPTPAYSLDEEE
jgi:transcriptional regulator with XRE-family HTH domain